MSSQPRTPGREEERRFNIRTLAIASVASATAAVVTSQFWVQGTWMAAAMTPVIVALVSEMLHKPTAVIAEKVTSRGMDVLPEAGAAAPPPRERELAAQRAAARAGRASAPPGRAPAPPGRAPAEPGSEAGGAAPPVRVYRAGAKDGPLRPRTRRQKVAVGMVALTAVLAFAIAAVAITGTELVTGGSIGKGDRNTTLFGGERKKKTDERQGQEQEQQQQPQPEESQPEGEEPGSGGGQQTQPEPEPSQPGEEPPPESQPPEQAPRAPEAPAPQQ
jgi:hypothetical protein